MHCTVLLALLLAAMVAISSAVSTTCALGHWVQGRKSGGDPPTCGAPIHCYMHPAKIQGYCKEKPPAWFLRCDKCNVDIGPQPAQEPCTANHLKPCRCGDIPATPAIRRTPAPVAPRRPFPSGSRPPPLQRNDGTLPLPHPPSGSRPPPQRPQRNDGTFPLPSPSPSAPPQPPRLPPGIYRLPPPPAS
ncbi:hypothetical protein PTTG_09419, partial [Puccinia triticina 1-1 BBBD Race 1]